MRKRARGKGMRISDVEQSNEGSRVRLGYEKRMK